jgi:hypothetical protein
MTKPIGKKERNFWLILMTLAMAYGIIEPHLTGAV